MSKEVAIPDDVLVELGFLGEQSSQIRGWTPLDDPRRAAASDFCRLAVRTIDEYGVSPDKLSRLLGLSDSTLRLKLGRHGYMELPPSQKVYQGVCKQGKGPAKKAMCKNGHDTSTEGTRYAGGKCKECTRERDRARRGNR